MWTAQTERLFLRNWLDEDVNSYLVLAHDVGYSCFSPPGRFLVRSREEAAEKMRQRRKLFDEQCLGKFPIFLKDSGEFIGTCGLEPYELDGAAEVELGYRLCLKHWGKGYAAEAANAILRYGFGTLKRDTIWAFALPQNRASLKVLEKLGFEYRREFLHAELPHRLYEIRRDQFMERKPQGP
jgi:[ribosomal protein S5]-alanine N-acetyltransferase